MWLAVKLLSVWVVLLAVGLAVLYQKVFAPGPLPNLRDEWWGPGQPKKVDEAVKPFKINIPDSVSFKRHSKFEVTQESRLFT